MEITVGLIAGLTPDVARVALPNWLGEHIVDEGDARALAVERVHAVLNSASDAEVKAALQAVATVGTEYRLYAANPLCRRVTRAYMSPLVRGAQVEGLQNLRAAIGAGPCVLLSNHLAYADTQVKDILLHQEGADEIAARIIAVAGPKVYGTPFRRVASAGLSTIKTAQSLSVGHNESGMSRREVGRIAIETIHQTADLMRAGHCILIYPEGSRSRTARLQPFLRGVGKYLRVPGTQIVSVSISGTEQMMPLHQISMRPFPVRISFGTPIAVDNVGWPYALELAWEGVSGGLPPSYQPDLETPPIT